MNSLHSVNKYRLYYSIIGLLLCISNIIIAYLYSDSMKGYVIDDNTNIIFFPFVIFWFAFFVINIILSIFKSFKNIKIKYFIILFFIILNFVYICLMLTINNFSIKWKSADDIKIIDNIRVATQSMFNEETNEELKNYMIEKFESDYTIEVFNVDENDPIIKKMDEYILNYSNNKSFSEYIKQLQTISYDSKITIHATKAAQNQYGIGVKIDNVHPIVVGTKDGCIESGVFDY